MRAAAAVESNMKHRLRARPKAAAAGIARSRRPGRRSRIAAHREASRETPTPGERSAACEGDLLSELNELLSGEEAGPWWKEEDERPEDSSLTDLLVQLVAANDYSGSELRPNSPEEASSAMTGPTEADSCTALHPLAAGGRCAENRNAVAARLNRLRKKEYVTGLEGKVARLSDENIRLEHERRALRGRVQELEVEARYLRAVLANDSALSQLLSRLTGLGRVKLSTSLFHEPPVKVEDHDYALPGFVTTEEEEDVAPSGGVCLHVDKEKVSVEFCPACAKSAASAAKM